MADPQQALEVARQAQILLALAKQSAQINPEVQSNGISMQPKDINPNPKPNGEPVIPVNKWSTGNMYPGISSESKLAANWNPIMDSLSGQG